MNIVLPRIQHAAEAAGFFKLVATNRRTGRRRLVADWFPNLITDVGLNQMGIGAFRNCCVVGTGSNAPNVADTQLQTTTAKSTTGAPNIPGATAQSTAPYYGQTSTGFRFTVGSAAGNLTEVGIGWTTGSGTSNYILWSRALILDGFGSPTTVTVLADEVLDVYYAIRMYAPTVDATYSINISAVPYDCVSRAASVTNASSWGVNSDRVLFTLSKANGSYPYVYNGDIGAITASPSGVIYQGAMTITNAAYSNNSLVQDATLSWGLDQGNLTGGIKSIYYQTGVGVYQTSFDPPIPKDNTMVLSIPFRVGWARRP